MNDFADFLEHAGGIVGGGAALGAAMGFVIGSIGRDLGLTGREPVRYAEIGAGLGGTLGLLAVSLEGRNVE